MDSKVDLDALIRCAWDARENAYTPYSSFAVGAALQAESGSIYAGCNVENISFGLTICAERAALFSAIRAGERKFVAMAIVAAIAPPASPCGACRQVLAEFSKDLMILCEGLEGERRQWTLSDLLPEAFGALPTIGEELEGV